MQLVEERPTAAEQARYYGLTRFFVIAAAALVIAGMHGVVQRIPPFSRWLTVADYGGYMVTNLAHTHITVVAAGTISITAMMYYSMQRILRRRMWSDVLTEVSLWCTVIGVFGFYFAMIGIGLAEGALVHQGYTYGEARNILGVWHKFPLAMTASIMGVGYWTFVLNVVMTVGKDGLREVGEGYIIKFFFIGALGLFLGTVQGVYQILPWSLDWLRDAREAGRLIDPMAHAHINLVGGVSMAVAGMIYFAVPRITGRPIYSRRLANASFYTIAFGVLAFWAGAILLGLVEGNRIIHQGMTFEQAKASLGPLHPLVLSIAGAVMGAGFWMFIANVLLTLRRRPVDASEPMLRLRKFYAAGVIAIFVGSVQGVIQILPWTQSWLRDAGQAGVLITPTAHAQMNIVGFVVLSLMGFILFVLPRTSGKPLYSQGLADFAFAATALGVALAYVSFLTLGFAEARDVRAGVPYLDVLDRYGMSHYLPLLLAYVVIACGYVAFALEVLLTVSPRAVAEYFQRMQAGWTRELLTIDAKHLHLSPEQVRRRGATAAAVELLCGWVGFLGFGWMLTGRGAMGTLLFVVYFFAYWVLFILALVGFLGPLTIGPAILILVWPPIISAASLWRTYVTAPRGEAGTRPPRRATAE